MCLFSATSRRCLSLPALRHHCCSSAQSQTAALLPHPAHPQLKRLADWGINELRSLLPAYGGAFWALLIILATIVLVGMQSIQSMHNMQSAVVP